MKAIPIWLWLVLSCMLVAGLAFAEAPSALAGKKYSYEEILKATVEGEPKTSATPQLDRDAKYYESYMKKLEDRRFFVILLSAIWIASLLIVLFLMRKWSLPKAEDLVLVMGLNLVIFGTLIAVLTVDTTEQLGAATGILGAMGGYLFGSSRRGVQDRTDESKRDSSEATK